MRLTIIQMVIVGMLFYAGAGEKKAAVSDTLNRLEIKHIDFADKPSSWVIPELRRLSIESDPAGKGVNIMLYQAPVPAGQKEAVATVNFDGISVGQLLVYVCEQLECTWSIDSDGVTVFGKGITSEPLEIQTMVRQPDRLGFKSADNRALKEMAQTLGLEFPHTVQGDQATLVWDPKSYMITHRNTPENLDYFNKAFGPHWCPTTQVITSINLVQTRADHPAIPLLSLSLLNRGGNEGYAGNRQIITIGDTEVYIDAKVFLTTRSRIDGRIISSDLHLTINMWSPPESYREAAKIGFPEPPAKAWGFDYRTTVSLGKGRSQTVSLPQLPGGPEGATFSIDIKQGVLGPELTNKHAWEHSH